MLQIMEGKLCQKRTTVRLVGGYCRVHLVSKAGSEISRKSPAHAFRLSHVYHTALQFTHMQCRVHNRR